MRVACYTIYPEEAPSVFHRIHSYSDLWEEQGIFLDIKCLMTKQFYRSRKHSGFFGVLKKIFWMTFCVIKLSLDLLKLRQYDVVIIHREVLPTGRPWVERLIAKYSHFCVYDLDDAIWFPPSFSVNQRSLLWYESRVEEIMSSCSIVVSGNKFIKEFARLYNDRVEVIPTPYDDLMPSFEEPVGEGNLVRIVWIGNLGNSEYLLALKALFEELSKKYSIILRVIGGVDIQEIEFGDVPVELCSWSREKEKDWLLTSDIGIMPLYDRDYEQGKCAFKIIQYFSAGLPVVASPVGMNKEVVINGVNGYQATDMSEWKNALEQLVASPKLRQELGKNGYTSFKSNFTRKKNADRWAHMLCDMIQ